jgi:selenocysteine-specific translation elongation factor
MHDYAHDMKNLAVGIFHDENLGKELGKKGTESDILMCNKKTDEHIFTFLSPIADKLTAKNQIISSIDAAVISITSLTPEIGETILLLSASNITQGLLVVPPFTDTTSIKNLIKNTSLTSFLITERNLQTIIEYLEKIVPQRNTTSPPLLTVDHSFSVKGVGEVFLGFVKQGIVKKHDVLQLLPVNKEVVVRSIQIQDKDVDEAEAGSRVGIAIKGATAEEMKRGSLLCPKQNAYLESTISLSFTQNRFYTDGVKEGLFHVTVGMQTVPVTLKNITNNSLVIEAEKPIVYTADDTFLLMNLNAKKLHLMGHGKPIRSH